MARADDFMLTAEEIRLRRQKRRRIVVVLFLLLILVVATFFGGRPTLNAIKAWQARRHADRAFALINKEQWNDAQKEAIAAYQLRPTEPQALRAVARFLSRTRQAQALDFWHELEKHQPLTRDDRQDEAAIAIIAGEPERAEIAVQALLESDGSDPIGWLLAAQLAVQKGAIDDAFVALDKIFADSRATEQHQFQAAVLERTIASGTEGASERLSDAWLRFEKLAQGKSAVALDSLVVLAQQLIGQPRDAPRPFAMTTEEIRHALEGHPLAKGPQKLLALDLLEHVDPNRREEIIGQAVEQWKNGDAAELLVLATWLNGKGKYQKTLDTIPLEKALQTRELFLQRLDALGGLGRWSDIKELLEHERFPLDPVIQEMYLARCSAQLGEKMAAENAWQNALEKARSDPANLMTLAAYAEKNGNLTIAESAYAAATTEAPRLRTAFQGRLRLAQATGETKKIHAVLSEMLAIWPNDPAIQNDEAYTRLLLLGSNSRNDKEPITSNQELASIAALAENLVKRNPRSLPHRTLLALARARQGHWADALSTYDGIHVVPHALIASALAVHAAVLAGNAHIEDAKTEAAQIPVDKLLPEERSLIESLRE
jgi:hypothetical protein